jgi:uncharacterized membrane protein HdeD (DUF308 family)
MHIVNLIAMTADLFDLPHPVSPGKSPGWLRVLGIVAGIILVCTALYVWVYPAIAIEAYIILFAIALIILGVIRFISGFAAQNLATALRVLFIIVGILLVVIGAYALAYPLIGALTLIYFFAFGLLFTGFDRIALSGTIKSTGTGSWLKYLTIIAGIFAIIVSLAILFYPGFGLALVFILISLELFLMGIELLAAGVTGMALLKL